MFRFPIPDNPVLTVTEHEHQARRGAKIGRFEDPRCFEARRGAKRHQETKME
jgi:hypothetical protein